MGGLSGVCISMAEAGDTGVGRYGMEMGTGRREGWREHEKEELAEGRFGDRFGNDGLV